MSQSHSPLAIPVKKEQTAVAHPLDTYDLTSKGEAVPFHLFNGLPKMVVDYLGGDIDLKQGRYTLFGKTPKEFMNPDAAVIGCLILHGEENDIETALTLIEKNPDLMRVHTIANDPLGRQVKGTVLQIAAMAGDVDVSDGINEAKEQGVVERIKALGHLSDIEIEEQLQCIASKEAQEINEQRNQRILAAIKTFGEGLIKAKTDKTTLIAQLDKALQPDTETIITKGYVFDPKILHDAIQWFEQNVNRFGGWFNRTSDAFWVNGIGKLQSKLSSRDAQCFRPGIGHLVCCTRVIPRRTLNNDQGGSYFYNTSSQLGIDFYLGFNGYDGWRLLGGWEGARRVVGEFCQAKTGALQKLMQCQPVPKPSHQVK